MIRRAETKDVFNISLLYRQYAEECWQIKVKDDFIIALLTSSVVTPRSYGVVAMDRSKYIGFALCHMGMRPDGVSICVIESMFVKKEHRFEGLGRKLFTACAAWGKSMKGQNIVMRLPKEIIPNFCLKVGMNREAIIYSAEV